MRKVNDYNMKAMRNKIQNMGAELWGILKDHAETLVKSFEDDCEERFKRNLDKVSIIKEAADNLSEERSISYGEAMELVLDATVKEFKGSNAFFYEAVEMFLTLSDAEILDAIRDRYFLERFRVCKGGV